MTAPTLSLAVTLAEPETVAITYRQPSIGFTTDLPAATRCINALHRKTQLAPEHRLQYANYSIPEPRDYAEHGTTLGQCDAGELVYVEVNDGNRTMWLLAEVERA